MPQLTGVDPTDKAMMPTDNALHDIDGVDIWPRLVGTNMTNPRPFVPTTERALLWETNGTMYKYYESAEASFWYTPDDVYRNAPSCIGCLFDVMADPSEIKDISASKPEIVHTMKAQLSTYHMYANTSMSPSELAQYDCNPSIVKGWAPYVGPCCEPKKGL